MKMRLFSIPLAGALASACAATEAQAPVSPVTVSTTDRSLVPAGTEFDIAVDEAIDTQTADPDQIYRGHFARAIVSEEGETIVPVGSPADLVVSSVREGGTFGTSRLTLGILGVSVYGRHYFINSDSEAQAGREGLGANERTGAFVGGGAALGTAIGAIAGGLKGAIIGGVLGGAAGAATQVITRGDRVRIPGTTVITFRLEEPWTLTPDDERPGERPIS